jgi:general secretion pathway protein D
LNPAEISADEAFNQLSEALAVNGFAVVKNGDVYTIKNARSAQRDNVQVTTEVPALKPQRLVTWIATLKHVSADDIQKDLRIFTSSYGEMSTNSNTNQLIITDWASNIQRIAEVLKNVDKTIDAGTAKIVATAKKERKAWAAEHPKKSAPRGTVPEADEPEKEKSKN